MSRHLPVLQTLLPQPAYDVRGAVIGDELEATGLALDGLQDIGELLLSVFKPQQLPTLLPLFEAMYGLPDICSGIYAQTESERFAAVEARRLTGVVIGLSIPYLIAYAASLGFPGVTIVKHKPSTCIDPCNYPLNGEVHRFLVDVHVPDVPGSNHDFFECRFRQIELAEMRFRFIWEA